MGRNISPVLYRFYFRDFKYFLVSLAGFEYQ
ncbi:hypothetical protein CPS_3183 [Colwellia psychrerythraea 34H]|uniref:Uncharacterized protein n=1 Tax=Colwellia psychrerythraea (strain 34H / ATCC BAA-681) TaxID=167879 RepID=Q47Z91_COLP3|nr:hypothetical protein CPS_3183 [Colwellia psychrerythraea 34H]